MASKKSAQVAEDKKPARSAKDAQEDKSLSLPDRIRKEYGEEAVVRFDGVIDCEVISTGVLSLDRALGVGGYPLGRIVEIYGPESSGKTTICLHAIAQAQERGKVAFIDTEHALDIGYASALGVRVEDMILCQPSSGEEAMNICITLCASGECSMVVVDSVAALTPRVLIDGEVGDAVVGAHARLMSQGLQKLCSVAKRSNTVVIFTNQIRMKIGVLFGNPETTTGGNALRFYASARIEVRRAKGMVETDEGKIGNHCHVKVVKNKVAPPFKDCELNIIWGKGVSREADVLECALQAGVCTRSGAWIGYGDTRIANGFNGTVARLEEHPDMLAEIYLATRERVFGGGR